MNNKKAKKLSKKQWMTNLEAKWHFKLEPIIFYSNLFAYCTCICARFDGSEPLSWIFKIKQFFYYCDERYRLGHKCKREFTLLIAEPNDSETNEIDLNNLLHINDPTLNEPKASPDTNPTQISLQTLMDYLIPQIIKVLGHVNGSLVLILVDSGSTHYFIIDCTAKFLGLQVFPTQNFHVLVGMEMSFHIHLFANM